MARNGKIALLPKAVQEQLNRRLDDNEPGEKLVVWLNSLPEVQAVMAAEFGGRRIREQNLSEWRKGGYRDWLRRQERCQLLRQLQADASDMSAVMNSETLQQQMSLVLMADLALTMREVMEEITDPGERARCLALLAGKIATLRREESHAARAGVVRQKWEREVASIEEFKRNRRRFMPGNALLLQRFYLETFGSEEGRALASLAGFDDDQSATPPSTSPAHGKPDPTQSGLLRPGSVASQPRSTDSTKN
jgi:hypothetical protein